MLGSGHGTHGVQHLRPIQYVNVWSRFRDRSSSDYCLSVVESWDVFVSWTRQGDGPRPQELVKQLRALDLRVWFDEDSVELFAPITAKVASL